MSESNNHTALSESTYYILLSLITPQHGYGIMQFIKKISNDRLTLAPGTLYGAIKALLDKDWIKLHNTDIAARKKVYVITDTGNRVLESEIVRLKELYQNGIEITGGRQNDEKSEKKYL
ncbi:helix-turn-helix transcriptional regulator [Neobacillus sp. FSL H8-0543]|uniref:PadR family transcriptional regulator n=1 Tax=Neobacillus sp. FSL H8-0543 TaxID=2954672 RepID=UPI0031597999